MSKLFGVEGWKYERSLLILHPVARIDGLRCGRRRSER